MTTLGNNIRLIPQSVRYGDTLEDYTKIVDYALPQGYHEDQVPRLGDSYPGETAPWDYIVVETGSYTSTKSPNQGGFIAGVKYAKPKIPFDSGIDGLKEVFRRFETGRRGRYMGTRIFLTADADAETLAETHLSEKKPMFEAGNWQYALLREKQIDRNWRVGIARITAVYDSYSPLGDVLYLNKGILEGDATAIMMWNKEIVPGTSYRVDEIYWDDGVRKSWVRVKGNNGWLMIRMNFRVRAVLSASNLTTIKGLVGKVNSDACAKINNAQAGTLWFNKFDMRQRQRGSGPIFDCVIGLAYDPLGWDTVTVAELQEYKVQEETVYSDDGTTEVGTQRTGSWIPTGDDTVEIPIPGTTASFAVINGYL